MPYAKTIQVSVPRFKSVQDAERWATKLSYQLNQEFSKLTAASAKLEGAVQQSLDLAATVSEVTTTDEDTLHYVFS